MKKRNNGTYFKKIPFFINPAASYLLIQDSPEPEGGSLRKLQRIIRREKIR